MAFTDHQLRARQAVVGLGAGLVCWAVLAALHLSGIFGGFELRLLDLRFRLRGERPASPFISLVQIDDVTIRSYGSWPIARDQYALLLQALQESGARAIGVDLLFPADAGHDSLDNQLLAYLSRSHPNIVHAISFQSETAAGEPAPPLPPASLEALRQQGAPDIEGPLASAASALTPCPELAEGGATVGHITVAADRDGAIRRQPPVVRWSGRLFATLTMRMLGAGTGHPGPPEVRRIPGGVHVGWRNGPSWNLPLDREGGVALDFAGDRGAFPLVHSMVEVLRDYQEGRTDRLRAAFADRYVLVGLDSRTEVTEDVGTTPFAATTPLVFLHANMLEGLLRRRFLWRAPQVPYLATLGLAALLAGGAIGVAPALGGILVALGGGAALLAIDFLLFARWGIDAPPMMVLLLAPAAYVVVTSARYVLLASHHRRREADIREGRSIEQQFLPEALVGRTLSRYQVTSKLGSGGMGIVFRAHDPRLARDVAIKVLPARALADDRTRRRFRREAQMLSRLHHPHVAGVFDFDTQDGTDFLVMELVEGQPLTARIGRGALPEAEVLAIARQILAALVEAHRLGIVHRDLKPDNVMVNGQGDVKVLDFGVASMTGAEGAATTLAATLTEVGHMVGTVPYMAPEVLRGERAEPRSDLYSLGVMLFEMATGRRPFPNDELHELVYTVLHQPPPTPSVINGRISPRLEAVVLRLLAKDPAERWPSASALLVEIGGPGARGEKELPIRG